MLRLPAFSGYVTLTRLVNITPVVRLTPRKFPHFPLTMRTVAGRPSEDRIRNPRGG